MKRLLWTLIAICIISNGILMIQYYRISALNEYHIAEVCDLSGLLTLREEFPIGTSQRSIMKKLKLMQYKIVDLGVIDEYEPKKYQGAHIFLISKDKPCDTLTGFRYVFELFFKNKKLFALHLSGKP